MELFFHCESDQALAQVAVFRRRVVGIQKVVSEVLKCRDIEFMFVRKDIFLVFGFSCTALKIVFPQGRQLLCKSNSS